jgi:hypothetical protein
MTKRFKKSRRRNLKIQQPSRVHLQYPDVEGLEPNGGIGHVNGPGPKTRREFIPTRYELEELTRLWMQSHLAVRSIKRHQHILGADTVNQIMTKVEQDFREHFGDEEWERFLARR